MKKTICKKLAAIVMTGAMAVSCLMPHMQVMAAQQTQAEGRMPLKGISYGYHSETYYLPADAQFYYEPQVDINPISGNIIIFTAKNAQNKVIAELDFGFEYVDIAVCTKYDEASDVGVIRTSSLYDIENGDSSAYMYEPDGRLILDRELGSEYLFQYDAAGRPVSCTCFGEQYLYEYNEFGKISTTYVKYSDSSDFTPEKLFSYDEKGNLLKYEFCYSNLDGVETEPMVDISYDDYGNPLSIRFYDCGYVYQEITMIY